MTARPNCYINKIILTLLILSGLVVSVFSQDKNISGVVNVYRRVEAFGPGLHPDNVTVNSVDSLVAGDTVLLIQMQGVGIVTDQNNYGTAVQQKFGEPGGYEFLLVQSVNIGTKTVVFRNNTTVTYDLKGVVQLIKVPYYNTATVTGTLTSKSWDNTEKTGGVLAMIVGRKLKLNAPIDVSGKGFRGGKDTIGIGQCVNDNKAVYGLDSYDRAWLYAGYKGEGLAIHDEFGTLLAPLRSKGQGINFSGGGGGNGKFSGGGGGSNRGKGGDGTVEKNLGPGSCTIYYPGAYGGQTDAVLSGGIFLGGGGGSSIHAIGSTGSSGGNGGGIVIIIADTISGNRNSIKSEGASAGNALNDGGAGGGGAGGSVVLSLRSFSDVATDSLKISVNGGNGGVNPLGYGNGGGGGGGLVWVSTAAIPAKVPATLSYGVPGPTSLIEGNGEKKYNFSPKLNGFLFNSISSAVTGNQIDSICSNVPFGQISGTMPVGGVAPHTYLWQSSTTSEFGGYGPAAGVNDQQNYSPGTITQSTWFRRVVRDAGAVLTDTSKAVMIIVQQSIKNNIVGSSDTICYGQNPQTFTSKAILADGNGKYSFNWQVSLNNSLFASPTNNTNESYTPPPALKATSWYRRTVTSGRCVDSAAIVKITVLDTISNNTIISLPQDICFGSVFTNLAATKATTTPALEGGDNIFRYRWESNINGAGWNTAPGKSDTAGYNPPEYIQKLPMNEYYFRRVVISGIHDVCTKTSASVLLRDYPVITNNSISSGQVICSGSIPSKLVGTAPSNGNGFYTYTWQDSVRSSPGWQDIPGAVNMATGDYQPVALTDTTSYRRIVTSSACINISNTIKVIVHKPIQNNFLSLLSGGTDTTICNGAVPHLLKGSIPTGGTNLPGDYSYLWYVSNDNSTFTTAPGANTASSYQPPSLSAATYYYKREVTSGACNLPIAVSVTLKVTVLPSLANNVITGKATVCYNTIPTPLTGSDPSGGAGAGTYLYLWEQSPDGTTWTPAVLINSTRDYQPPALIVATNYRRLVKSGTNDCCSNTSNPFNLTIDALPTASITSTADTTICEGSKVNLKIHLTGASPWQIIYRENLTQITVTGITGTDPTILASPVTATALTIFNYSLFEVKDKNNCIATSLSGTRKADVYKVPVAYAGLDADTCGLIFNLKAVPSAGTGTWYYPVGITLTSPNSPSVTATIPLFAGGRVTHKFVWEETNWQCKSKDSVNVNFDKEVTVIDAGPDTTLYSFDNILHMVAHKPNLWETGKWTLVSGTGDFSDDSDTSAVVENLSKGANSFLWTVVNGKCKNEDKVNIDVYELSIPQGFSPNNDPGGFNNTFIITGLDLPNQDAELRIVNGAGTEVFKTSNIDSVWEDWAGKNSKGIDLPEGTYYYLLKITSHGTGRQVFKKSGFIILKRY